MSDLPTGPALAPAGWYPSPDGHGYRYWGGLAWTDRFEPPRPGPPAGVHTVTRRRRDVAGLRPLQWERDPDPVPARAPAHPTAGHAVDGASSSAAPVTIVISRPEKPVALAFVLAYLFGPLGLGYVSVTGAIVMTTFSTPVVVLTLSSAGGTGTNADLFVLGLALLGIIWTVSCLWACVAASVANEQRLEALRSLYPTVDVTRL